MAVLKKKGRLLGPFGRIIRTLGFIAFLIANLYFLVNIPTTITFLENIFDAIKGVFDSISFLTVELSVYLWFGGLLLLIFTLVRSVFFGIILTIVSLYAFLDIFVIDPVYTLPFIASLKMPAFLDQSFIVNNLVTDATPRLIIGLVFVLLAWALFAYRRPKRISTTVIRFGLLVLFLGILVKHLPSLLNTNWNTNDTYLDVQTYIFLASLAFTSIGSALGVIGFFRK